MEETMAGTKQASGLAEKLAVAHHSLVDCNNALTELLGADSGSNEQVKEDPRCAVEALHQRADDLMEISEHLLHRLCTLLGKM
jgi:hypothetical protein